MKYLFIYVLITTAIGVIPFNKKYYKINKQKIMFFLKKPSIIFIFITFILPIAYILMKSSFISFLINFDEIKHIEYFFIFLMSISIILIARYLMILRLYLHKKSLSYSYAILIGLSTSFAFFAVCSIFINFDDFDQGCQTSLGYIPFVFTSILIFIISITINMSKIRHFIIRKKKDSTISKNI